ncbi:MAG: regulatory protein RecX [Clostridia bacterium]|nr:regulatory protein RecX [Clostridia bacterium]
MTVSAVEPQGRAVRLYFSDAPELLIREKDLKKHPLAPGDTVDVEALTAQIEEEQASDAMEAALGMLDRSARSVRQIGRALISRGYLASVAESVTDRLTELRLLDDEALARRIIENGRSSGAGVFAIRRKLLEKGIPEETFETMLAELEDVQTEAAVKLLGKYLSSHKGLKPFELRSKAGAYLARHGFPWESVTAALDRCLEESE